MTMQLPLLSILIWLPIIGAAVVLLLGDRNPNTARRLALLVAGVSLLLCVPLYTGFDFATYSMQFQEHVAWLPSFGINYDLGIDGIALPMILLSSFTTVIVILATWKSIDKLVAQYLAAFLVMQGLLVGVFSALDSILFYVFWEATLVPMYLIIGIWGSTNRVYAAIKFFLYTFLGSVLFLVALLYLGFHSGQFSIIGFYATKLTMTAQILIFIAFLLAFAIKVPMWPVHTWLPDAHTEAPAGGSIMLAAVLLKLGGYGFLRFSLPIVPDACRYLAPLMISLSLIAIIYIAFVALVQRDLKKLIAYSSISHMGFVTLGCFMIYRVFANSGNITDAAMGLEGAMTVMISHGFISGALFAGVGFMYDRMHTRMIDDFGGVVNSMPIFASLFLFFALANAGLPGTSGFVGEFMVILDSMKAGFWIAAAAATTLIIGAAYTLWMYKRVFFGATANDQVAALKDIRGYELVSFASLAAIVLWIGLHPAPLKLYKQSSIPTARERQQIDQSLTWWLSFKIY